MMMNLRMYHGDMASILNDYCGQGYLVVAGGDILERDNASDVRDCIKKAFIRAPHINSVGVAYRGDEQWDAVYRYFPDRGWDLVSHKRCPDWVYKLTAP